MIKLVSLGLLQLQLQLQLQFQDVEYLNISLCRGVPRLRKLSLSLEVGSQPAGG